MESGFIKANSTNLPRIDAVMLGNFFASNTDFCSSEFRNAKTSVILSANLTIINFGLNLVWTSPMLVKLRDENQTILSRPITENEEPWIAAITTPAAIICLLVSGSLINWLGRKTVLLATFIPRMFMCLLTTFATEVWMILLARAIGGGSEMITLSVVSTYASEVAGTKIRGASGTVTQIMAALGMMIMFAVGPFISYLFVNVMVTSIAVVSFIPLIFIPESPYFLNSKGRTEKAEKVLTYLRGTRELALEEIKEYSKKFDKPEFDKWSLIKDKVILKTTGIMIFLSVGVPLLGYNAMNIYLQTIFESTQTSVSPEISSLISGLIQLAACFCTFILTDRFGRKPILCISLIAMCAGMIGLASFFVVFENGRDIIGFLNYLPLISIAFVIFGFNAGMGSLHWILVAELYDGRVRPYGVSAAIIISTIFSSVIILFFPGIINSIGASNTYWIFSVTCAVLCLFIFFVVPETKQRSFADIQKALGRREVVDDAVFEGEKKTAL